MTEIEQILQTGAKKIQDHGVVVAFGAEPPDERNANTAGQGFVDLAFVFQLRMFGLDRLQFDSDLFARDDVDTQVDITYDGVRGRGKREEKNEETHRKSQIRFSSPACTCLRL